MGSMGTKPRIIKIKLGASYMYGSILECIKDKYHMKAVDAEGYCNLCSYKDFPEDVMQEEVHNVMLMALDTDESYVGPDGRLDVTRLVINTANHFEQNNWANDSSHWIWKIAIKATEVFKASKEK